MDQLQHLYSEITSDVPERQLEATASIRKLLTAENPPIQLVIDAGFIPLLVQLLSSSNRQIQFESLWALTNITSGTSDQTKFVVDSGAVPLFIQLLELSEDDIKDQAIWALANIAGDSAEYRDLLLNSGILDKLLPIILATSNLSTLRHATWTITNLCRGTPRPSFEKLLPALPVLARLIYSTDNDILEDACTAISELSQGASIEQLQLVIESGACRRLVELLMHASYSVQNAALRAVGNICVGDDTQTQYMINVGVLPCLQSLLKSPVERIIKESCWAISNITAGNTEQIQFVIDSGIIADLTSLMRKHKDFDIQREALFAVANAMGGGTHEQIFYIVNQDCIKPLCDFLECEVDRIVEQLLKALENMIFHGNDTKYYPTNPFFNVLEESGGLEKIDKLQVYHNPYIRAQAISLAKMCRMYA